MAEHLVTILGDMLHKDVIQEQEKQMPTPMSLKGKILVKAKRLPPSATGDEDDNEDDNDDDDERDDSKKKKSKVFIFVDLSPNHEIVYRKSPRSCPTWLTIFMLSTSQDLITMMQSSSTCLPLGNQRLRSSSLIRNLPWTL